MRMLILAAATLVGFCAPPARAACGAPDHPGPVGAISGHPERDTIGFVCDTPDSGHLPALPNAPGAQIVQMGANGGEPERDTFGYDRAVGH
jgi:hypothetical protein